MRETDLTGSSAGTPDLEVFTTLYEQYATRVFTYIQYRCPGSAAAQDLSSQVFEQALRSLPSYDAQRAPLSVWLFAIARHVVTDWQRREYLRRFILWEAVSRRPDRRAAARGAGPARAGLQGDLLWQSSPIRLL